jgi:hypothetical protein
MPTPAIIPSEQIEGTIKVIRGHRVMLDVDLATLYGVETRALVQAVKRHTSRFPADFMFQLSGDEFESLRSQIVTSKGRGGRRYAPYAFTELGVAMLSSVLNSDRAVEVNIQIMRAFVRVREMLASNAELTRKLASLERKYDSQFKAVFDAIRQLMTPPAEAPKPRIGYQTEEQKRNARGLRSSR